MNRCAAWTMALALTAFAGCGSPESPPPPPAGGAPAAPDPTTPRAEPGPLIQPPPSPSDPTYAKVHEYTKYFYDGDLERLQGLFTDEMKQQLTLEQLVALRRRVESEYGNEIAVLGEETQTKGKYRGFVRWARFDKHPGPIEVQWILREDDSIAGFFVRPVKRNRG